ncbi:MinD/ParA family ATP-binding protein [Haloarcula regularis]|uniref:MinD/ParA family ATP-binding protein n=1 Tax=Haloarcula regularis TaxID=3033392 RepID=UPI0023E82FF5|nr:division plane positioning ATPase MipZ [Halomicroarcula sp. SYNS111]
MLAIAGGKGGCGKTTTALGIARAVARTGRRPVVVDTDLDMPDLHRRAGVSRTPGVAAAADRDAPLATAQASPRIDGVDVLPGAGASSAALASVLDALDASVRPVLLDCPAGPVRMVRHRCAPRIGACWSRRRRDRACWTRSRRRRWPANSMRRRRSPWSHKATVPSTRRRS